VADVLPLGENDAEGQSMSALPSSDQIERARAERARLTEDLRVIAHAEERAVEAARWAQSCKEFDSDRGFVPDDPDDVAAERHGWAELRREVNQKFSMKWVEVHWRGSASSVVESLGIDSVRHLEPRRSLPAPRRPRRPRRRPRRALLPR
jgi:hypothetical protein